MPQGIPVMAETAESSAEKPHRLVRILNWFARLPTVTKSVITTVEFGLSVGCIWAAWTAGGDMALIIPALALGLFFGIVGIATIPELKWRSKTLCMALAAILFTGIGGFLYWHFRPKAPDAPVTAQPQQPSATPTPTKPKLTSNYSRLILVCDSPKPAKLSSLAKRKADLAERLDLVEKVFGQTFKGNLTDNELTLSGTLNTPTGPVKQDWLVRRSGDQLYVSITNEVGAGNALGLIFGIASLASLDPDEDFAKQMREKVEHFVQVEPGKCKFV